MKNIVTESESIDESSDRISFRMPGSAFTLFRGLRTLKTLKARKLRPLMLGSISNSETKTTVKSTQFHLSRKYEL